MKKLKCELNEKFGNWTIADNISFIKNEHTYIKAQCKCGKIEDKCLSDLVNERSKSCKSCAAQSRGISINIGEKYKSWTVIKGPEKYNDYMRYEVQCECGTTKFVQANELTNLNKNFKCLKCSAIDRGLSESLKNGRIGDLTKTKYTKLEKSANSRELEFNVSMEYLWELFLNQNKKCAITGEDLDFKVEISLDRINSSKGYIEGNVQWVTIQANLSKHIMSIQELLDFCNKVINHANQQLSTPLTKCESSETNP